MNADSPEGEIKPLNEFEKAFIRYVHSDVLEANKIPETSARIEPSKLAVITQEEYITTRSYYGVSHDGNNFEQAAEADFFRDHSARFIRKSQHKDRVFGHENLEIHVPSREDGGYLQFSPKIAQRSLELGYDDNGQINEVQIYYLGRKNSDYLAVMLSGEDFKKLFNTEDANQELEMKLPSYGITSPSPRTPHPNFRYVARYDPEKKVIQVRREDRERTVEDADGNKKLKVLDKLEIARYVDVARIQDELNPEDLVEDPFGAPTSLDARSWLLKDYFQLFGVKWDRYGDIDMKKVDWKEAQPEEMPS